MVQIISVSGGSSGVQNSLAQNEDLIVAPGVQRFSSGQSVISADGGNSIVIGSGSGLNSFSTLGVHAAILLDTDFAGGSSVAIGDGASVRSETRGIVFDEDDARVDNDGVVSSVENAVQMAGTGYVSNAGRIASEAAAVAFQSFGRIDNAGVIQAGSIAVSVDDSLSLNNTGTISGVAAVGSNGQETPPSPAGFALEVINSGTLSGVFTALIATNANLVLINDGLILATNPIPAFAAIVFTSEDAPDAGMNIVNSGSIIGDDLAIVADSHPSAAQSVVNTGRIVGGINFGEANDLYQGRDGRIEGTVSGGDGLDRLVGGAEENVFRGGAQNDILRGNGGDDDLDGEGGADRVNGGAGDDLIRGGFSADRLLGNSGDDEIYGDEERDGLFGGKGDDLLYGGAFSDQLAGGAGDDTLGGGNGFDTLSGGRGDDQLSGGAASDTFVLKRRSDDDVITDFQNGMDQIDLTAFGLRAAQFAAVVAPALNDAGGGATFLDLTQLGGNGSVLIQGLAFGQAGASDFIL